MKLLIDKIMSEPDKIPIYTTKQIDEIISKKGMYNLTYNLSPFIGIFNYLFGPYVICKNGIIKSKKKESFDNRCVIAASQSFILSIAGPSDTIGRLINISNQNNKDINGLYSLISPGSRNDHWILQKIIVSDS